MKRSNGPINGPLDPIPARRSSCSDYTFGVGATDRKRKASPLGIESARSATVQSLAAQPTGANGGVQVNSTARWPERLEQVATLLRADGAAIVAFQGDRFRTVFSCRVEPDLSWSILIGDELLERTLSDGGAATVAVPAGRWGDTSAFAMVARIDSTDPNERGILCALRHGIPFDAVEVDAGRAAATLLTMAFTDARARAEAERQIPLVDEAALAATPATVRVLVVEDHPAMRLGIEALLERAGMTPTATSSTCGEALQRVAEVPCDVVLLDLGLPDASGLEAVHRLRAATPLPIVVFSVDRSPELVRSALRAGANGYLAKDSPAPRVAAALRAAVAGLAVVSSESVGNVVRPSASTEPPSAEPAATRPTAASSPAGETLSARELDLLRYLAEGYTNKEIARVMVLAEDTVKKGVQALIAKLEATDRTHAVVLALRNGLID